jgi:tyrosine-protein phosphatase YwqE
MWFFRKRKEETKAQSTFHPSLFVDVHSHLIPGIDDGAQNEEESAALLKALAECGYKVLWTTPHIMSDYYKNDVNSVTEGLEKLRRIARENDIALRLEAAAEYYLDDAFFKQMKKEKVLAIDGRYVLFETSYVSKPLMLEEMIFAIGVAGYTPLMAHPERYRYVTDPKKEYARLKDLGVLFQVNINSFGGHYGRQAKALAQFLEEHGMIDFLGSDAHRIRQAQSVKKLLRDGIVERIEKRNTLRNNELL